MVSRCSKILFVQVTKYHDVDQTKTMGQLYYEFVQSTIMHICASYAYVYMCELYTYIIYNKYIHCCFAHLESTSLKT